MQQKTINRILLILFTLCVFLAKGYNLYNSDNADIIPIYQHMADHKNFSGEFYMEETEKPSSSRFFISVGVAALLRTGLSIEVIMLVLYILSFTLTAIGLWKLSIRFSQDNPVVFYTVTFSLYTLTEITFRLGSAGFKFSMPLPSTFAAGICVFAYGCYFENKRPKEWVNRTMALFLCGLATLIQAFVGLFFGGVLLLYLFYEAFIQKTNYRPVTTILAGGLLFVIPVAMAFLSGMTGAENPLTPAEIVEILAKFRQPHHNYPASWAMTAYLEFGIIFATTIWMLKDLKNDNKKLLIPLVTITGCVAFLSVSVNFIATSVLPLTFLSKLQSGRAFAPFILAVCAAWGMKGSRLMKEKHYWEVFSVWGLLVVPLGGVLLFPFMLLTSKRTRVYHKLHTVGLVIVNILTVIMIFAEPTAQPLNTSLWLISVAVLFLVLNILQSRNWSKSVMYVSMTAFLLLFFVKGPAFIRPDKPYSEMNILAEKFNTIAENKEIVLSDPWLSESLYFRFYSGAGTVVSFKCFPHADDGIREWYNRMEEVGGVNLKERKTAGIPFSQRTWEELLNMAREYHASYLLSKKSWLLDAPIKPLVQYEDWMIYQLN